jgi:hypothetical protein
MSHPSHPIHKFRGFSLKAMGAATARLMGTLDSGYHPQIGRFIDGLWQVYDDLLMVYGRFMMIY